MPWGFLSRQKNNVPVSCFFSGRLSVANFFSFRSVELGNEKLAWHLFTIRKNGVGAWECWNVSEKEKTEIGDVDKMY
jgi:hypothetical protein